MDSFSESSGTESAKVAERSLGLFSREHPVRALCWRVFEHRYFGRLVLLFILGNCFFLALTEPFATCCTSADLADESVVKVDVTNFTVMCDINNAFFRTDPTQYLDTSCCIDARDLVGEGYHKCASAMLRHTQEVAEIVFNVLFTIEMTIKVVALGFWSTSGSYIRDPWNVLDFVVVAVGWFSMLPGVANLSALRTFRVLRPLRTLSSIPGMRPIVGAMIASVKSMVGVMLLCGFLFAVFGIVGLQLFSGALTGRCHYVDPSGGAGSFATARPGFGAPWSQFSLLLADPMPCALPCAAGAPEADGSVPASAWQRVQLECLELSGPSCYERGLALGLATPNYDPRAPDSERQPVTVALPAALLAGLPAVDPDGWFRVDLPDGAEWGNFTQFAPRNRPTVELPTFCLDTRLNQVGSGFDHFDNIGYAWLTIFTTITLEGWTDTLYALQYTFGHPVVVFFYFFVMIWVCSFFMLELTLAVINDNYDRASAEEKERAAADAERAFEAELEEHARTHEGDMAGKSYNQQRVEAQERQKAAIGAGGDRSPQPWGPAPVRALFRFVTHWGFSAAVTLLILLNTATLSMEHYGMDPGLVYTLAVCNVIFTLCFTLEMVLKMVGLGPRQYFRDYFNAFDFVVVTISLVELSIAATGGNSKKSGLGALRTFRLMRVFKLARSWKNLRKLLATILLSLMDVTNAGILLVIIMFIFTLLGMQLFGGMWTAQYFCDDPHDYVACLAATPRPNFDSFWWGFVTVFQILTGENWNAVLYVAMTVNGEVGWLYFSLLNIIGSYMVLNLFLAILLARFDTDDVFQEEEEAGLAAPATGSSGRGGPPAAPAGARGSKVAPLVPMASEGGAKVAAGNTRNPTMADATQFHLEEKPEIADPNKLRLNPTAWSFGLFAPDWVPRRALFAMINDSRFDNVILFFILVSTVLLAMDEPWVADCSDTTCEGLANVLHYGDMTLNVVFTAEMLLKMIALGVFAHEHSYLRSGWNVLDFIIVVVSLISLGMGPESKVKALKSLRALRALRPLRVISRSPGMRLVVNSIIAAVPAIANVTIVVLLFMLIFAILAVQNFSGGFNSCNDPAALTMMDCVGYTLETGRPGAGANYSAPLWFPAGDLCEVLPTENLIAACRINGSGGCQTCLEGGGFPRVWGPHGGRANSFNFDNVGAALLAVFEVTTGEMWPDLMYQTTDIAGPDTPMHVWPHRQGQNVAVWYMMVILVCNYLMISVFVGVIIDNFNDMKSAQEGSGMLTEEQKTWVETMKRAIESKPTKLVARPPPSHHRRTRAWAAIHSTKFEVFIMVTICLNTLVMMMSSRDMSQELKSFTNGMNYLFLGVFVVEAMLKLFAMGAGYFTLWWNRFDFFLVVAGLVGVVGGIGPLASLLRIFRVARVFRLVRTSQNLMNIFRTLVYSIPSMFNIALIFCLIMLIFSILAMNLFANIKRGEFLSEDANFESFFMSMQTLFRAATGESYNGMMHDCMVQEPYCSDAEGNCGFPVFAPLFFCTYYLLANWTMLSMITAVVLDNFNDNSKISNSSVTEEHIEAFKEQWALLDPTGSNLIHEQYMVQLVSAVPYPLGVAHPPRRLGLPPSARKRANALIQKIDVPSLNGMVSFFDVLTELTAKAMPNVPVPEDNQLILKIKTRKVEAQTKAMALTGTHREDVVFSTGQVNAIMLLQSTMRGYIYRRKMEELTHQMEGHLAEAPSPQANVLTGVAATGAWALDASVKVAPEPEPVVVVAQQLESGGRGSGDSGGRGGGAWADEPVVRDETKPANIDGDGDNAATGSSIKHINGNGKDDDDTVTTTESNNNDDNNNINNKHGTLEGQ